MISLRCASKRSSHSCSLTGELGGRTAPWAGGVGGGGRVLHGHVTPNENNIESNWQLIFLSCFFFMKKKSEATNFPDQMKSETAPSLIVIFFPALFCTVVPGDIESFFYFAFLFLLSL